MKIVILLHNIRSTYNVGAILRTFEGFSGVLAAFSGYTPVYNDNAILPHLRAKIDRQIEKTALGAEKMVEQRYFEDPRAFLREKREQGWKIVGLENNIRDERLFRLNDPCFKDKIGDKIVLVLGEEVAGIDREFYDEIDYFVEIPMTGRKESFNVSVAAGIALYALSVG